MIFPFFTNVPRKDNNSPHRHQKIISGYCACSLFYFSYKNEINKTLPNMSLISLIYQDGPFLLNLVDFFSDDGIANANLDFQLPTKWFPAIHQLKRSIIIWIAHQLLNGIKLTRIASWTTQWFNKSANFTVAVPSSVSLRKKPLEKQFMVI